MNILQKALLGIGACRSNLRTELETSKAVSGIILLDLIKRTTELERDIAALTAAIEEDSK